MCQGDNTGLYVLFVDNKLISDIYTMFIPVTSIILLALHSEAVTGEGILDGMLKPLVRQFNNFALPQTHLQTNKGQKFVNSKKQLHSTQKFQGRYSFIFLKNTFSFMFQTFNKNAFRNKTLTSSSSFR